MRLVIATTNKGKLKEYRDLFRGVHVGLEALEHFGKLVEPLEDGDTFEENARIKAVSYASQTGEMVLADDSGLEVTALDGAPGVLSARYGGNGTGYGEKMTMLLQALQNAEDRSARFACSICVARPDGTIAAEAFGECRGVIAETARGTNGFGYDPLFIPDGQERTFGEMTDDEKRTLSHRAKAAEQLIRKMLDFIGV